MSELKKGCEDLLADIEKGFAGLHAQIEDVRTEMRVNFAELKVALDRVRRRVDG